MPRFRNTATTSSSVIPPDVPPFVHDSAFFQETGYSTYCTDASKNQTSTTVIDPRASIPTPSPSPNSQSVTLPSPLTIGSSVHVSSSAPPKRKHTSRASQSPNHIPRPRNAFILFRSHALARGMVKNIQQNEASREIARIWKSADEGTRKRFEAQAEEEKRIHKLKYPGYRYAPRKNVMRDDNLGGQEGTSSIGVERESRRTQMRESVRYNPISRPTRTKRTLPTPDTSPEPSTAQISAAPLDISPFVAGNTHANNLPITNEHTKPTESENNVDPFAYSSMFDGLFGSFPSFSLPQSTTATPQMQAQPEFSFPSQEEQAYTIDHGYVPCLASSAYYSPIPVHADRRLAYSQPHSQEQTQDQRQEPSSQPSSQPSLQQSSQQSPQQSTDQTISTPALAPTPAAFPNDMSGYFEFPEFSAFDDTVDLDELARRALRPSAPLWNQQVNMIEARSQWFVCGLDGLEFGHEFSALDTSDGISASSSASVSGPGLTHQPAQTQTQTMNTNEMNTTSANMNTNTNTNSDAGMNLDMDMFINTDSF